MMCETQRDLNNLGRSSGKFSVDDDDGEIEGAITETNDLRSLSSQWGKVLPEEWIGAFRSGSGSRGLWDRLPGLWTYVGQAGTD